MAPAPVRTHACGRRHALATVRRNLENEIKDTRQSRSKQTCLDRTYSAVCHAPAAAEQRDFTSTCLCLTPTPPYTGPVFILHTRLSAAGRHLSVPHRPAPLLHASATPQLLSPTLLSPPPFAQPLLPHWPFMPTPTPKFPPPPRKAWTLSQTSQSHMS